MKRFVQIVSVLLVSASIGACVSAKQRAKEQEELERSIQTTSDPEVVKDCSFMMELRPDGLHHTPEAQAASLVIPKKGVSWVVFSGSGRPQLYSCSRKGPQNQQQAEAPVPTPVETEPETRTSAPADVKAAPAPSEAKPDFVMKKQPETQVEVAVPAKKSAYETRVTNNPEAVKGCKFLESFAESRKVSRFQEDVVKAGGNLGYIVATNQNGDVIGESYLCPEEAKP